jgi:glucose uptake protein GlcU
MKRTLLAATLMSACTIALIVLTSFKNISVDASNQNGEKAKMQKKGAVTFYAHDPVLLSDGTTYTGTVTAEGAINNSGTNIMYTQLLGMALHCTIIMTFPDGTLTIRMNCNMKTFNGRWKILEGTGAYVNTKGEGSLVMPNDVDEILTGFIY